METAGSDRIRRHLVPSVAFADHLPLPPVCEGHKFHVRDGQRITYDSGIRFPRFSDVSTDDITRTVREGSVVAQRMRGLDLHHPVEEHNQTVGDATENPDNESL